MNQKHNKLWWGPPKKFDDRTNERKVSWLELFYDLVYVAAIAQLTHHQSEHLSWTVVVFSFLLFSLIFWSWVNGSQYYDLHGSDSVRTRLMTFWQMLAVAAVAITLKDTYEGHHQGFAIAFSVLQILITYLWWSVGLYDPSHRIFNKYYTLNYSIAFILLIVSIFSTAEVAVLLWIIVLLFNLTPGLIGANTIVRVSKERGEVFSASAAIVERFGLFTIIVLAESVLGTVSSIAEIKDKQSGAWVAFIFAILIAFLLWSLYFDMTSEQETKKGYNFMQLFIGMHFPLLASLGVLGACIKILMADLIIELSDNILWMFCASLSMILFMIVGITKVMKEEEEDRSYIRPVSKILVYTGLVILILPFGTKHITTIPFMAIISLLLFFPVFIGMRSWVKYKFNNEN